MTNISPSFWQDKNWKFFREQCGEKTFEFSEKNTHALVIEKSPHFLKFWKKKIWELQRGPFGDISHIKSLFQKIFQEAKKQNIERVRIFPPLKDENFWEKIGSDLEEVFPEISDISSAPEIFPEHTLFLDLTQSEDEIFAQMKQGGRRNIRKAIKAEVEIFEEKNIENFWKILQETASRDGFTTNKKFVYERMLESYSENSTDEKKSIVLSARDETGEVLASKIFLISGEMGIYYYGASSNSKREKMAPYLLQWEGIKWAKKNGAKEYDFLGISPENSPEHQLASVSQFKLRFGGTRVVSDQGLDFLI